MCLCLLLLQTQQLPELFRKKNKQAKEEDVMTMVPVQQNYLKLREWKEVILSQFEYGLWVLPLGVVCSKWAVWHSLSLP